MLTYFPTPYPDELFYSVLCRYYVSTGIRESNIVKDQLFQKSKSPKMGFLFPSSSMRQVFAQLPSNVFHFRRIILENTPFLYFTRMYATEDKERMLADVMAGKSRKPANIYTAIPRDEYALRYCPLCAKADAEMYGEPYYHVEHQIPLSSACVKHRCMLKQIEIHNPKLSLNGRFWPLSQVEIDEVPEECTRPSELIVNRLVREYWKLPISIGPTEGHNNLIQSMLNRDYQMIQAKVGPVVDKDKLYDRLREYHGSDLIEKVFGTAMPRDAVIRIPVRQLRNVFRGLCHRARLIPVVFLPMRILHFVIFLSKPW